MGCETVTVQNLEVVAVDVENNVILIKGNVPGPKKGLVIIRTSVKNPGKVNDAEELVNYTPAVETPLEAASEEVAEATESASEEN